MTPLAIVLLTLAPLPQQVELDVTYPDGRSGTARTTRKAKAEGGWVTMMAIELEAGGRKIKVRAESTYDIKFEPKRKTLETLSGSGKRLSLVVADFDAEGVLVVSEAGAKRTVKRYDLEAKWPRRDPTIAWFLGTMPKPGGKSTFMTFDMSALEWVQRSAIYRGRKTIKIGTTMCEGYHVTLDEDDLILDSEGLPLQMVSKGVQFRRSNL